MQIAGETLGWATIAIAIIGILYHLFAAWSVQRFFARPVRAERRGGAVSVLKPLYGAEPRLLENLTTFLTLDHDGPVQMICGVQHAADPAISVVRQLQAARPDRDIVLVVDPTVHGASGKISNLINMLPFATHDVLVLSDSDIAVAPDYLSRVLNALDAPGVAGVTCLYRGRGDAGFWSRFGAAGQTYQFIIGVVIAVTYRLAAPCMGSTIALRRDTLERIGGFGPFADTLADDHAIGQAILATGGTIAVPPMFVTHAFDESGPTALWRHEIRWAATVRDIAFGQYVGSGICMPLPVAMLACLFAPAIGLCLVAAALVARWIVVRSVDAVAGASSAPPWMAWLHDVFGLTVYFASFFTRSVDWRGHALRMTRDGQVSSGPEISA